MRVFFSSDETLQDVAETEIESNWDQVVDKLVILRDLQVGGKNLMGVVPG
jgi:hypothetical protein